MRNADPNEHRCISRRRLGYYSNVIVASIYSFADISLITGTDLVLKTVVPALQCCLVKHPLLCTVLKDVATSKPSYTFANTIDVRSHVFIDSVTKEPKLENEDAFVSNILEQLHNQTLEELHLALSQPQTKPPWVVHVLPLKNRDHRARVLVSFVYSHSHGDGLSGAAFHETLFQALQANVDWNSVEVAPNEFPAFEVSRELSLPALPVLPVSWQYLIGPILGYYLPGFVANMLGFKAEISGADEETWSGSKMFLSKHTISSESTSSLNISSRVRILSFSADTLAALLQFCRRSSTTLTALLSHIIAQVLATHLRNEDSETFEGRNLIAQIPINLRRLAGIPQNTIGNFASTKYIRYDPLVLHTRASNLASSINYDLLRDHAVKLKKSVSTLEDTPIGLLAWVSDIDGWLKGKIDMNRDASFQLSNLGMRNAESGQPYNREVLVEETYFCQSADVNGEPLSFNVASTRGGKLNVCACWQPGALALRRKDGQDQDDALEEIFISSVLEDLEHFLRDIARTLTD